MPCGSFSLLIGKYCRYTAEIICTKVRFPSTNTSLEGVAKKHVRKQSQAVLTRTHSKQHSTRRLQRHLSSDETWKSTCLRMPTWDSATLPTDTAVLRFRIMWASI